MGSIVAPNPAGWELGIYDVDLTPCGRDWLARVLGGADREGKEVPLLAEGEVVEKVDAGEVVKREQEVLVSPPRCFVSVADSEFIEYTTSREFPRQPSMSILMYFCSIETTSPPSLSTPNSSAQHPNAPSKASYNTTLPPPPRHRERSTSSHYKATRNSYQTSSTGSSTSVPPRVCLMSLRQKRRGSASEERWWAGWELWVRVGTRLMGWTV